jgi:secretion/DNA translocation related TadE-like protein
MVPDRGSASIWLLAVGLVLVAMGVAGAAIGAATVARHRAQAAADLGALAGAARALDGPAAACGRATEIAGANGGRVVDCLLDGFDLILTVEVSVTPVPPVTRTASASARAGPVVAFGGRLGVAVAAAGPVVAFRSRLGRGLREPARSWPSGAGSAWFYTARPRSDGR